MAGFLHVFESDITEGVPSIELEIEELALVKRMVSRGKCESAFVIACHGRVVFPRSTNSDSIVHAPISREDTLHSRRSFASNGNPSLVKVS